MMREKLIKYWERKERQMKQSPEFKATFLSQAFGALDFAMEVMDNWDEENELINLWENGWKPRLEAIVYEV